MLSFPSTRWSTVAILLAGVLALPAADWPQWRGPHGDGITREVLPDAPAFDKVIWKTRVGTGFSSVAIQDGRVYTMGHADGRESVWCLDAVSGKEVWRQSYPAPLVDRFYEGGPGATPTVRGGRIYTYSKHGWLHCHRAEDGKLVWERDMVKEAELGGLPEWGFACSPYFLDDQTLLIESGATFALNPATGTVLWRGEPFTPAYGTPVAFEVEGRRRIAVMKSEGLVVMEADGGATVAVAEWETAFDTGATTPIVKGNQIFISTGYDRGCALFELRGNELHKLYEHGRMSNHMNNSVLINGHLFGFDGTAHRGRPTEFVCLEWATGREKWRVSSNVGLGCGSVLGTGGDRLMILSERGELMVAKANVTGFKVETRAQVLGGRCWTVPVLAGGRVYCRNARGDLVCVAVNPAEHP